jgi:hypothetical protein
MANLCWTLALVSVCASCNPPTASFGAERTLNAEQRKLQWSVSNEARLMIQAGAGDWSAPTPAGWEVLPPAPERFRHLLWRVAGQPESECYLTVGVAGGLDANIGRWYGQFGQEKPSDAAIEALPAITLLGKPGHVLELTGTYTTGGRAREGFAMLLAYEVDGESVTTVKFTGPQAVIAAHKQAFLSLVPTIAAKSAAGPVTPVAVSNGGVASSATGSQAQQDGGFDSDLPTGWEALPPEPARFRHMLWRVTGQPESECYLTLGVGGGLMANVTRWYGQFGKPAPDPAQLAALPNTTLLGKPGHLLELDGSYTASGKTRDGFAMLLVYEVDGDAVTTMKFTGPKDLVAKQKSAFLSLVASLRPKGAARPAASQPATNQPAAIQPGSAKPEAAPTPQATKPPAATGASDSSDYTADTPVGFDELPPEPARFRHLLWRVTGQPESECYLTVGVGGGLTANVNRWYGQFGKPAPDAAALAALPGVKMLGKPGRLLELQGSYTASGKTRDGFAMLLIYTIDGDNVTTLKFTGPKAVVEEHKFAFIALAGSVRAKAAGETAKPPALPTPTNAGPKDVVPPTPANAGPKDLVPSPPANTGPKDVVPPQPPIPTGHSGGGDAPFTAAVPAGWLSKAGSAKALHHTFGTGSEIYLGQLGNDLLANVNVWRGALGQAPLDAAGLAALPKTELLGPDAVLLDVAGKLEDQFSGKKLDDARMLLAAGIRDGTLVFVKCVGPATEIGPQREAFVKFCASIRRAP